jgi:hypothetical protein
MANVAGRPAHTRSETRAGGPALSHDRVGISDSETNSRVRSTHFWQLKNLSAKIK